VVSERAGENLRIPGALRQPVAAAGDDDRLGEVLVQVVDVLDVPVLEAAADGEVVERGEVDDELAQADATRVRADRVPNLAASSMIAIASFTPAVRHASIWTNETAFACSSCLKTIRFCTCSPVAIHTGATARAIAAWPSTSSGLVGSSTQ
jgi:hypothetical protein